MKLNRQLIERKMETLEADEWEVGLGPDDSVVVVFTRLGEFVASQDASAFETALNPHYVTHLDNLHGKR
jgi:hypothetical protein